MKNDIKYIRKHKHWYEKPVNNFNQCYVNKILKKCNLSGTIIINTPKIVFDNNVYEFIRGHIEINKNEIDTLNNKDKKLFKKIVILFDVNSYDIILR